MTDKIKTTKHTWFICTKDFICKKCERSNAITYPLKASNPPIRPLILSALKELPLRCENQECREPLPGSDEWEIVEATPTEAKAFESNPKSERS
jgi:hypothetical protein